MASAGVDTFGRIVYQSGKPGVRRLHLVRPDGTTNIPLTPDHLTPEQLPFATPLEILASTIRNGPMKGTPYPCIDQRDPAWSPDGRYVVYACLEEIDASHSTYNLWLHDLGPRHRLSGQPDEATPDDTIDDADFRLTPFSDSLSLRPAWSPEGARIAFATNARVGALGPNSKIATLQIIYDTTHDNILGVPGVSLLTNDPFTNASPTWSFDGTEIAFSSNRPVDPSQSTTGTMHIWKMHADGSSYPDGKRLKVLTNDPFNDTNPSWSPDGFIAFMSDRPIGGVSQGHSQIWVLDRNQLTLTRISDGTAGDQEPAWQPTGILGLDLGFDAGLSCGVTFTNCIDWQRVHQAGIGAALVETVGSQSPNVHADDELAGAQEQGLLTGVYIYLKAGISGGAQVRHGLVTCLGTSSPAHCISPAQVKQLRVVALDFEDRSLCGPGNQNPEGCVTGATANVQKANRRLLSDALLEVQAWAKENNIKVNVVIYASHTIFEEMAGGADLSSVAALWDANPPSNSPAVLDPNLRPSSVVDYGNGWTVRLGRQYTTASAETTRLHQLFGIDGHVQPDIFDPGFFVFSLPRSVTSPGVNVLSMPVDPSTGANPVSLSFDQINGAIHVSLSVGTGPALPTGFVLGDPPTYYDITTTPQGQLSGSVRVCVNYSSIKYVNVSSLQLFHYQQINSNVFEWVPVSGPTDNDPVAKIVCGTVGSLSPFAVFEPIVSQITPVVTVAGGRFAYDGSPHKAMVTATGLNGSPVRGLVTINYVPGGVNAPVNVGTYTVSAQFVSADSNYTNASVTGTITITSAMPDGTVAFVNDMQFGRVSHQTTLLANGLVLTSGGQSGGLAIAQAELFNPNTGAWSVTGTNVIPRFDHTATVLIDGRVLAAGGVSAIGECTSNATAEIYDPARGTWSLTGRLPSPLGTGHIAIRLLDGRVLAAGGGDRCGTVFSKAAIFDPTTNTWAATGNMTAAREFHSAALLQDGRVLVAGGVRGSPLAAEPSAEIYDPTAGTWTAVANMTSARQTSCNGYVQPYLAALTGGRVLAAGGFSGPNCSSMTPERIVTSVTVSPSSVQLADVGRTQRLTVTAQLSDGSTRLFDGPLQFASTNTAVASIDASGLITSVAAGTTTVTATPSGFAPVGVTTTVQTKQLTSIAVSPLAVSFIGSRRTQPLVINGLFSDGSQQSLTTGVSFSSLNGLVASVDSAGVITSGRNGATTITVSAAGLPAVQVPVAVKSLVGIASSPTSLTLVGRNQVQALLISGQYSDGSQQPLTSGLSFISSNPSVARVDLSGFVTSGDNGTAIVSVSAPGVPAVQIPITVKSLARIALSPATATLIGIGVTQPITVTATYTDASTNAVINGVTFSSSDTTVATVTESGLVTSVAPGTATITATFGSVSPALATISVEYSATPTEADAIAFSVLNLAGVTGGQPLTLEADARSFSVLNVAGGAPNQPTSKEADGITFSVLNTASGISASHAAEADAGTFSVLNTAGGASNQPTSKETDGIAFTVLNIANATGGQPAPSEVDAPAFSILNADPSAIGGGGGQPVAAEADGRTVSVFNVAGVPQGTVTVTPESSIPLPAGTTGYQTFISQTADPLGPFRNQSVWYAGYQAGGSSETLNGAHLLYRFRIDFGQAVNLDAVVVSGLGDYSSGGSAAVLRVLDANRNVVAVLSTTGQPCCTQSSYRLLPSNVSGQTFFIDEFDYSTNGRYRDHIALSYRTK
jgi:Tol biopolymer transport system component